MLLLWLPADEGVTKIDREISDGLVGIKATIESKSLKAFKWSAEVEEKNKPFSGALLMYQSTVWRACKYTKTGIG